MCALLPPWVLRLLAGPGSGSAARREPVGCVRGRTQCDRVRGSQGGHAEMQARGHSGAGRDVATREAIPTHARRNGELLLRLHTHDWIFDAAGSSGNLEEGHYLPSVLTCRPFSKPRRGRTSSCPALPGAVSASAVPRSQLTQRLPCPHCPSDRRGLET